ncbi:7-deoxyloganetin glucosyltransferase-like [Apium graveolens]|uniref:7-deoxyloganetin glucosyltransferase-like n=1 Tax=Apium graveolens TaxID=4045 RepID=UPI003D79FD08
MYAHSWQTEFIEQNINMGSMIEANNKPHALCIPYPAQGHITPMFKLAKLLHHKGFHISFVNTEFNHNRLIRSWGPDALDGLPDFRFYSIPDGLPPSDPDATQDIPALCKYTPINCLAPFSSLISKLNDSAVSGVPPVTCIVSDGVMSFTLEAAEHFGLPEILLWTTSACGLLAYMQYHELVERGYTPLQDMSDVSNGYLDTKIDWALGMKDMKLKDFPSFIRTTDPNDIMLNFLMTETSALPKARALILNTYDTLEQDVLDAISATQSRIYTVGPLHLLMNQIQDSTLLSISSSLWKEEVSCIDWLDKKEPNSVVYVNFGSITTMTAKQLTEFAWGLANSKKHFLWMVRPDIIAGDTAMVPSEFLVETRERGLLSSWCSQEQVLKHPAIGGFLTHNGWNSTIESIASGVPVICWPFFAEQQTNCKYSCVEWGIGMEINNNVKRDDVEELVRELMDGEKGKKLKKNALEWQRKAEAATCPSGSSSINLDKLVDEVLLAE